MEEHMLKTNDFNIKEEVDTITYKTNEAKDFAENKRRENGLSSNVFGVVTFNNANNYGAFCQEYALQTHLFKKGIKVEVLNIENNFFDQKYRYSNNIFRVKSKKRKLTICLSFVLKNRIMRERIRREKAFEDCREVEITESHKLTKELLPGIVDDFAGFISGSDQVWNFKLIRGNYAYFLDFIPDDQSHKKLSYAASINLDGMTKEEEKLIKDLLSGFSSVLVRERSAQKYLEISCGVHSDVVLDPVFFLNASEWKEIAEKSRLKNKPSQYVLVYVVAKADKLYAEAIDYADQHNLEIVFLGMKDIVKVNGKKYNTIISAGPYEFIDLVLNAEVLYTTSFHGIAMCIIFKKPFFYEMNSTANMARISDLLNEMGIIGHVLGQTDEREPINWEKVTEKLEQQRYTSDKLLMRSINNALSEK